MNDRRPNILFLLTDDQRFDTIAALGNEQILTPNFDDLVERGTAFTHAAIMGGTSDAVCMPSRAMLLTGRTLFHLEGRGESIPPNHTTMPEHFGDAGYQTFGTGKWHNGPDAYARSFSDGAEIFFGGMDDHWQVPACDFHPDGDYPDPRPHPVYWLPGERAMTDKRYDHVAQGVHSSELFATATCAFLARRDHSRPFFAYVAFMAPHDPRTMPPEYLALYDPEQLDLPPNFMSTHPFDNGALDVRDEKLARQPRDPDEIRRHLADYYAMITHLDAQIGRILLSLREIDQLENTIIVLAGDNGLALGQHGLMGKQNLYDHSVRVPLVIAGPGVPAGERRDALCYLIDIFPTLCDLTGCPTPPSVEGHSLRPVLDDADAAHRDVLLFAYQDVQRAARDERYKLIEYAVDNSLTRQLFDCVQDPWEMHNVAANPVHSERLQALSSELDRWRTELDDWGDAFWTVREEGERGV